MPLVYDTLRGLARKLMSAERRDHTLQPTALVNEAWLRLVHQGEDSWEDRDHFLRMAARAMRRVLIDHARSRARDKRQGDRNRVEIDQELIWAEDRAPQLLEFDEALGRLENVDAQLVRIVELRFFVGHTIEETARILGVSHGTVERGWSVARLWLAKDLDGHGS